MPGPPPKHNRSRRPAPTAGEWVTLPLELYTGSKPRMPGKLAESTQEVWRRLWSSPMAHMWAKVEWSSVRRLVLLTDAIYRGFERGVLPKAAILAEVRQLEATLGISAPGRQRLRWRLPLEADEAPPSLAAVTSLPLRPDPRKSAT